MMRVGTGPTGAQPNNPVKNLRPVRIQAQQENSDGQDALDSAQDIHDDGRARQEIFDSSRKHETWRQIVKQGAKNVGNDILDSAYELSSTLYNIVMGEQNQAPDMDRRSKEFSSKIAEQTTGTVNMGLIQMLNASGPKFPVQPMVGGCGGCGGCMGMMGMPWLLGGGIGGFGWGGGLGAPLGVC